MPFYEYECQNCKFYTEVLQKISDPPLAKCPSCGKKQMKKLVSAPMFRLKGTGWYETDFKSDKENKRNLAVEKESDSGSEGAGGGLGKPGDAAKAADAKPTEAKASDAKPAESKSSEAKDSKSGDSKSPASSSKSESSGASRGRSRPNLAKSPARTAAKSKSSSRSKAKAAPARRRGR